MQRLRLCWVAIVALAVLPGCATLTSDGSLPPVEFERGPGFYFSIPKLILIWLVFLVWVRSADWVNADCIHYKLDTRKWNPAMVGSFLVGFLLVLAVPWFLLGFPLLLISFAAPFATYVVSRNHEVEEHEKVFTLDHLRFWFAERLELVGIKIAKERGHAPQKGPPIELEARGGESKQENSANLLLARRSPGFNAAREILVDALQARAEKVMLDYRPEAVALRYQVDGVWAAQEDLDRETGDPILVALKQLSNIDPEKRQKRHAGEFGAKYEDTKYTCYLVSEATKNGERAVVTFDDGGIHFEKLPDLGMREKMVDQLVELMHQNQGLVLFSAPPENGLRTTFNAAIRNCDRFMRGFVVLQEASDPEPEIENAPIRAYDKSQGEGPMTIMARVLREYPDAIVARDLPDAETVAALCEQATEENRVVLSRIRAKDAPEALLRVLLLKVPPPQVAKAVSAVMGERLVRKLCEACKEAYEPPPQLLKQLGLPPGKVESFYRPPQAPEKVCPECGGVGYLGRTPIFQLLVPDENVRRVLVESPKIDLLRKAARKAGMRTFQEEGVLLVVKGITSLEEVRRVLKD